MIDSFVTQLFQKYESVPTKLKYLFIEKDYTRMFGKKESQDRIKHMYDDTEVIYIIKTGFQDKYMVVFEDAFEMSLGKTILGTKEEIEGQFRIKL